MVGGWFRVRGPYKHPSGEALTVTRRIERHPVHRNRSDAETRDLRLLLHIAVPASRGNLHARLTCCICLDTFSLPCTKNTPPPHFFPDDKRKVGARVARESQRPYRIQAQRFSFTEGACRLCSHSNQHLTHLETCLLSPEPDANNANAK